MTDGICYLHCYCSIAYFSRYINCNLHPPARLCSSRLLFHEYIEQPTMDLPVNESLTLADKIVLDNLRSSKSTTSQDDKTVLLLDALNSPSSTHFQPTVFTQFPEPPALNGLWQAYTAFASGIVRRPTDIGMSVVSLFIQVKWLMYPSIQTQSDSELSIVFLNHILLYLVTSLPSAIYLFYNFTAWHAVLHWAWTAYSCGPFTLMMHNSIHQNGVLKPAYRWLDVAFPYLICPIMGHTVSTASWNCYPKPRPAK